jgi:uncharacterized membrane protein
MATVEKSIEVDVPLSTCYNQWTQFETFPEFMSNVRRVEQRDDTHLRWTAEVGGKTKEWDSEVTEQQPDKRISWRSTSGSPNAGTVEFEPMGPNRTRVRLRMDYEPEGAMEKVGSALGFMGGNVEGDLRRFKEFIESRRAETGAWRGEVEGGQARRTGRPTTGTTRTSSETRAGRP